MATTAALGFSSSSLESSSLDSAFFAATTGFLAATTGFFAGGASFSLESSSSLDSCFFAGTALTGCALTTGFAGVSSSLESDSLDVSFFLPFPLATAFPFAAGAFFAGVSSSESSSESSELDSLAVIFVGSFFGADF